MLEKFSNTFNITSKTIIDEENEFFKDLPIDLFKLLSMFGGITFNNGLYRMHSFKSSIRWSLIITDFFNSYTNTIYPFGFDWMGRQFCLSSSSTNTLFMFDPSTGEDFKLEQNLLLLHNEDFVISTDDMLSINLFNKILSLNKRSNINYDECIGFKVPLFLGGKDSTENYELQDLEVYWHIQNQLYRQIKDLPDGTKIGNIKIE